mgnify:CR=1 FL=1
MSDIARIALGPKRQPTRNGEPVSNGIPSTATSTPSSCRVCGRRMSVVMPDEARGSGASPRAGRSAWAASALAGGGVALDEELKQGLSGEADRRSRPGRSSVPPPTRSSAATGYRANTRHGLEQLPGFRGRRARSRRCPGAYAQATTSMSIETYRRSTRRHRSASASSSAGVVPSPPQLAQRQEGHLAAAEVVPASRGPRDPSGRPGACSAGSTPGELRDAPDRRIRGRRAPRPGSRRTCRGGCRGGRSRRARPAVSPRWRRESPPCTGS